MLTPKDIKSIQSSIASEVSKANGIQERLSEDINKLDTSMQAQAKQPLLVGESSGIAGPHPAADDIREAIVLFKAGKRLLFDAMSKVG